MEPFANVYTNGPVADRSTLRPTDALEVAAADGADMAVEPSTLAQAASLVVAGLAVVMATLGYKSYRRTGNPRLVFIVLAFGVFALKGLFASFNLRAHDVGGGGIPHDTLEFMLAVFDLVIVALLFIPFFLVRPRV